MKRRRIAALAIAAGAAALIALGIFWYNCWSIADLCADALHQSIRREKITGDKDLYVPRISWWEEGEFLRRFRELEPDNPLEAATLRNGNILLDEDARTWSIRVDRAAKPYHTQLCVRIYVMGYLKDPFDGYTTAHRYSFEYHWVYGKWVCVKSPG